MNEIAHPNVTPITPAVEATGERSSLAQEVYERLKWEIFEFRMPPGQRYSEHGLAAALAVSRTPLRLALHVLAHEGFMRHVGGHSCWQVQPLDLAYYEDLYDFRTDIEAMAVRRLCARIVAPDWSALLDFWDVDTASRSTDGAVVAQADEAFHRSLVEWTGNAEMLRCYNRLTDRIRIIRRLDFISPDRIRATYDEHAAILKALRANRADEAERLIRAHIETSRIEIRRITFHQMALAVSATGAGTSHQPLEKTP